MSILKVYLKRDLRKNLLQGSPWVYKQAVKTAPSHTSQLAKVFDHKSKFLGWAIHGPKSDLALRMLSVSEKPPTQDVFSKRLAEALRKRQSVKSESTNAYRLVNGEGDLLPGFVCDVYNDTAIMQFDGVDAFDFWDQDFLSSWLLKNLNLKTICYKPRHDSKNTPQVWGEPLASSLVEIKENDVRFYVDIVKGQKTGFFLDQRENRNHLKNLSQNKSVLNLFSYSGGFSIYAGLGKARQVTSVDIAEGAIQLSQKNWDLNELEDCHQGVTADVFEFLKSDFSPQDIVICDPPSLAKSEKQKRTAIEKYIETFSLACKKTKENGHLMLSSCSSHINFDDFIKITSECLSKAKRRGQIMRVSGQGSDHPYPHACPQMRYLKFIDCVVYK